MNSKWPLLDLLAPLSEEPGKRCYADRRTSATHARVRRLNSRILTTSSDHELFAYMFKSAGGNVVALDYLRQATVRGFFRGEALLGGYVLNARAPFRYSSWVPARACAELHNRGYLVDPFCAEITCMWMHKGLGKLERNRVYVQTVADAFSCGKRLIFAGSRVENLARIQKKVLPKTVYKGAATFDGTCEIYCTNRYAMIAYFVTAAIAKYRRDFARMICRDEARPMTGRMRVPVTPVRPSSDAAPDFTKPELNQI